MRGGVCRNFSLWPAGRCDGEEAAEGRKCEGGAGNDSGRESVHDTNLRSVGEQNRCQVGPTILFERPAKIPRSFLRSFSLWARHHAETSAERNVHWGAAEFFPWPAGRCGGGGSGGGKEKGGRRG